MFNKNMIDVLSQINSVSNSIVLKYPKTVAVSDSGDMLLHVDFSEIDSDSFPDIGLKDSLGDFLNLIKLFPEERSIDIENNRISVSSGSNSSSYITDNIALMDAYNQTPEQFDKTESVPSVASFDINTTDIKNIKSASGVFKDLSEVIFKSQDGDVEISLAATNKLNAKSNTYSVTKTASTSKEFSIKIPVENFKLLPLSEYTVDVKYNAARDSYRIILKNKSLDGFKILMSVKV